MSITPQTERPALSTVNVLVGAPIGADQWQRAGALLNWLSARGAVLVPWCTPGVVADNATPIQIFRFYVQPRRAAIQRRWYLELEASATAEIKLRAPSTGTDVVLTIPTGRSLVTYTESLSASSDASQEISVAVEVVTTDVEVTTRRLFCAEVDRASLEQDATDYGVDISTAAAGRPMFDSPAASGVSLGGVVDALTYVDTRRAGIFHWTTGDSAVSNTSATYADLMALAVPVQAAKELRADTTGVVMWTAYARMASAGTGKVRIVTSASGVTDSVNVTSTSYAWTTPRAISIDCEDLADDAGLLALTFDDLAVAIAGSGSVAINVKHVSVYVDRAQSLIGGA